MRGSLVGVVVALPAESRTLCGRAAQVGDCVNVGAHLRVAVSGIGEQRAGQAATALVDAGAGGLVSWGCAAGLSPALRAGDLCLPEAVVSGAGEHWPTDTAWRCEVARALAPRALSHGALAHACAVLAGTAAKRELAARCRAVAADMESAAVARVAQRHGLPLLVVRSVVDPAALSLPAVVAEQVDDSGRIPLAPLLGSLLRQPGDLLTLLRLASGFRAALASLRMVAAHAGGDLLLTQALAARSTTRITPDAALD